MFLFLYAPGFVFVLIRCLQSFVIEEAASVTCGFHGKESALNFTSGPLISSNYPQILNIEGIYALGFLVVQHKCKLDSAEEMADFMRHVMVRLWEMTMMTNGAFHDYANEALIRMICMQVKHLNHFKLADDDKDRLLKDNNKLK